MAAIAFDTYAAVKSLKDSGADEPLAEAIVSVMTMSGAHRDDLATKADLESLEQRVIARMTIRTGAMIFAAAGLAVAVAKIL